LRTVREVDATEYAATGLSGFEAQFVAITEMAAVVMGRIAEGGCGPALHLHPCDQYYYLLEGTMTIRLGHGVHRAGPGSLACIPAGLPHCNWNEDAPTEVHLELLAPMVRPGQTHFVFVDSLEDAPPWDVEGYVTEAGAGRSQLLTREDPGRLRITAHRGRADATASMRVLDTDQLAFVAAGPADVAVGAEAARSVRAPAVVVLPAQVPHVVRGAGPDTCWLEILAPTGDGPAARSRPVELRATGDWQPL
jgi:quercetin dioxygenase-like cupin family protein